MESNRVKSAPYLISILLLLMLSSESTAGAPLGYVEVEGALYSGWDNRVIPIYDNPDGKIVGGITLRRGLRWCLGSPTVRGKAVAKYKDDSILIGYCRQHAYYARQGDFVRILDNSISGGLWLGLNYAMPDNADLKLTLGTEKIIEGIAAFGGNDISKYSGYRLYEKPDSSAEILFQLDENKHMILGFTGRHQGAWLEAVVVEQDGYPRDRCLRLRELDNFLVAEKIGWMEILTRNGLPGSIKFRKRKCR